MVEREAGGGKLNRYPSGFKIAFVDQDAQTDARPLMYVMCYDCVVDLSFANGHNKQQTLNLSHEMSWHS